MKSGGLFHLQRKAVACGGQREAGDTARRTWLHTRTPRPPALWKRCRGDGGGTGGGGYTGGGGGVVSKSVWVCQEFQLGRGRGVAVEETSHQEVQTIRAMCDRGGGGGGGGGFKGAHASPWEVGEAGGGGC